MEQNFQRALAWVLEEEGGWSDHPEDNGGATMKGITISVYSNWLGREATKTELRNISDSTVAAIYKKNYWDKIWGDRLPAGVDYVTFDFAVNSGPGRSVRFLQGVVRADQDGAMGPRTLEAVESHNDIDTVRKLCAERLKWLKGLADWKHFGRGWEARINRVMPRGLALVSNDEDEEIPHEIPMKPGAEFNFFEWLWSLIRGLFSKGK